MIILKKIKELLTPNTKKNIKKTLNLQHNPDKDQKIDILEIMLLELKQYSEKEVLEMEMLEILEMRSSEGKPIIEKNNLKRKKNKKL